MGPFYEHVCTTLGVAPDQALVASLKEKNTAELAKLQATITDATENLGETEIRDALLAKASYLSKTGAKTEAETAFRETYEKSASVGQRMDVTFFLIRLGFLYFDKDLIRRNLDKADSLLAEGGDWERRNRLKVYKGYFALASRDFKQASSLFLDAVSTFTCQELLDYREFVQLTVFASMLVLSRPDLKKKVIHGPEIQEQLHELPTAKAFLNALYHCNYDAFFRSLAEVETVLLGHRLLAPHAHFYVREMRVLAYNQLLESYKSVTLDSVAKAFGVSAAFVDRELSRFVAQGRLNCKIDRVAGIVETNRPDAKNAQYQAAIKQGDVLLNRVQKLSQVINL